jgi:hypothetical protein
VILLLKNSEGGIAVITSHSESPKGLTNIVHVLTEVTSDFSALGAAQKLLAANFKALSAELRPEAPSSCELDELPYWFGLDAAEAVKQELILPAVFLKNCVELGVATQECAIAVSACECSKPKGRASELAQLLVETLVTRKNLLTLV